MTPDAWTDRFTAPLGQARRLGLELIENARGIADLPRLERNEPGLLRLRQESSNAADELRALHHHYVTEVSSPEMAASLEVAAVLLALCRLRQPRRVLDMGSGFSTFAATTYARQAAAPAIVVSVDDSTLWLERTKEFLRSNDRNGADLMTWNQLGDREAFDLVFYDFSSMPNRLENLGAAIGRLAPGGLFVADDVHKAPYRRVVKATVGARKDLCLYSLRAVTLDRFGRYSALVMKGA